MKQGSILIKKAKYFIGLHLLILLMFFLWKFDLEAGTIWERDDGFTGVSLYIGQWIFMKGEALFSEFNKFLFDIFEVSTKPDDFL